MGKVIQFVDRNASGAPDKNEGTPFNAFMKGTKNIWAKLPRTPEESLCRDIFDAIAEDRKISAIMLMRDAFQMELREAKDFIDGLYDWAEKNPKVIGGEWMRYGEGFYAFMDATRELWDKLSERVSVAVRRCVYSAVRDGDKKEVVRLLRDEGLDAHEADEMTYELMKRR